MPTIGPSFKRLCRDTNSRYLPWMDPDDRKERSKSSIVTDPGLDFMICPNMLFPVGTIRYMRIAGEVSGMPFTEKHLWIGGRCMRMESLYMMVIM